MKNKVIICLMLLFAWSSHFSFAQYNSVKEYPETMQEMITPQLTVKTIRLGSGVQLEYAEQGNASGLPVIFLHGITDSWHSFEKVLPFLPASIHAFAISQRGHGNSDRPATGYNTSDFAADVADFIKQKNIGAAVIVGHSMGGVMAQRFLIDHPQLAKAMVLICTDASFNDNPGIPEFYEQALSLKDPIDRQFMDDFQKATLSNPIDPLYFDTLVSESMKVPARVFQSALKGLMEDDLTGQLKNIKAPVLILWGDKDSFCSRKDQDILAKNISQSKLLVYENTGHALHWERPERFVYDLLSFIQSVQ